MKIFSSYVGKDLDFDVMEKLDMQSNKTMLLIKHDSLRDVVYNQLKLTEKGNVSYTYIKSDRDHAVVECTIDDGNGRVVKEVGEAVPETLDNTIALTYPVLTASQRAFDRAAILLLMLAGKQLSNDEMGMFISVDFEPGIMKDDIITSEDMPVDEEADNDFMPAPINAPLASIPDGVNDVVDEVDPAVEMSNENVSEDDKAARLAELGKVVPLVGNNVKDKLTLDELYEKRLDYLQKIVKIANPSEKIVEYVNCIKEYMNLKA